MSPAQVRLALLALAVGAFGIGTTEFAPMGLLPVIADGVGVSIPTAGGLVSAYAIGVMLGAPLMTLLLSHRARRSALIFLMAIFTLGNVLSGRDVAIHEASGVRGATALGIADDGALRVRDGDGEERRVHAGDVSVRA